MMKRINPRSRLALSLVALITACDFRAEIARDDAGTAGGTGGGGTAGGASAGGSGGGHAGGASAGGVGGGSGGGHAGGASAGGVGGSSGGGTAGGASGGGVAGGGCMPHTCADVGKTCGVVVAGDGCGGPLQCGQCSDPLTCQGGGVANVCGIGVESAACSVDGWCWVNALPQGNWLNSVWGSSATDVWAVGSGGAIVHFDGSNWSAMRSGTSVSLSAVSGSSANDIWVVGAPSPLHWNGTGWSSFPGHLHSDVWVAGPNDAWAAGINLVDRWDGVAWRTVPNTVGNAIWGAAPNDVWLVGNAGQVSHWNGSAWTVVASGTTSDLRHVRGRASNDVWATGDNGTLLHWDGTAWQATALSTSALGQIFPAAPNQVFLGSNLWNGSSLATFSNMNGPSYGVWGSSGTDVWAAGIGGSLAHFNGTSWSPLSSKIPQQVFMVPRLWGSSPTDVLITYATPPTLFPVLSGWYRWDGANLVAPSLASPPQGLGETWGFASNDIFIDSSTDLQHWNGVSWSSTPLPALVAGSVGPIRGSSANDLWIGGQNAAAH
jgi:hypothetical protein